ncbi:MAG: hypothetical protein IMZ66_07520 [Planctomycetes bacterium]|nr:hypothetical protein [Planctomycetota bacterium]
MKRTLLARLSLVLVAIGAAGALGAARAPAKAPAKAPAVRPDRPDREPTRAETLTQRIAAGESKLRGEKDPAERKSLTDDIETARHELGPTDAAGKRLTCLAMWHDAALRDLDTDTRRVMTRAKPKGAAALALDGRIAVRRMASLGLAHGWADGSNLPKYQFDALGTYLYNNLPVLDRLFDEAATWLTREDGLAAGPDAEAAVKALAAVKEGIAGMTAAVEGFEGADTSDAEGRQARVKTLPAFANSLRTVYDGLAVLRPLGEKGKAAAPDAAGPPAPAPAEDAGSPEQEKAALEHIGAVAKSLKGEGWETIQATLEKLTVVTGHGLKVSAARGGARQMLATLSRLADYLEDLTASKSAYPEYVAQRQERIAEALRDLASPSYRRQQYSHIRLMCEGDQDRRALERGPLSPEASQGLLVAATLPSAAFAGAKDENLHDRLHGGLDPVIRVLGKMGGWPPKDMAGQLRPLYGRCAEVFGRAAEALGKAPQDDLEAFAKAASETAVYAGDVERLLRADAAIKAVAKYVPAQAPPMYARLVSTTEGLVRNTSVEKRQERQGLDEYFQPFQKLAGLRLPGPEHTRTATTLSGGAYKPAATFLAGNITRNLVSAAQGNSSWLDTTLDVRPVFSLLRHRAVAETAGLAKVGTVNLDPFSAPEKPWTQFVTALDGNLRVLLKQYGSERRRDVDWTILRPWDAVYCTLAAAQDRTRRARQPGETDLDFLMRHLAQVADPNPPDAVWFGWAAGYHATEAAVCLASGFDRTAGWHLSMLNEIRMEQHFGSDLTWHDFDPPDE